jgi:hypothetical protein
MFGGVNQIESWLTPPGAGWCGYPAYRALNGNSEDAMNSADVITILNGLIETCRDGQRSFEEASRHVGRHDLGELFAVAITDRTQFCGECKQNA